MGPGGGSFRPYQSSVPTHCQKFRCSPTGQVSGLPVPLEPLIPPLGICPEEEIQRGSKFCVSETVVPFILVHSSKSLGVT